MGEARRIIWLVGLAGLVWVMWQWNQCRGLKVRPKAKEKVERALRARTPEDCPACGDQSNPAGQRPSRGKSSRGLRSRAGGDGEKD